jgi:uncharacterized membrane protein YfcA
MGSVPIFPAADPWFWAVGVFAVFLTGISMGGVGGGAGGVSTPLLSLVISPVAAAAIMLPVLCLMDIFGIRAYLWKWDVAVTRRIVAGGLLGTVGGALTVSWLDDNWIRIMLGVIALGFLAWSYLPRHNVPKPSNRAGWLLSALSGYTTFITHAGGPPVIGYMLALRMEKVAFISTSLVFFAAMNYAKILPYVWLGLLDARTIATGLALFPVGLGGIYFGIWLQKRMSPLIFYRVVHVLLFLTGTKLLYDGITAVHP